MKHVGTSASNVPLEMTLDLELYLTTLLTENERLAELERYKVTQVVRASHDFRGSLTMLNLHLYMLERTSPDNQGRYINALKDGVVDLTTQLEDLLSSVRQNVVPDDDKTLEYANLDEPTR